jgi:hypothetical protein
MSARRLAAKSGSPAPASHHDRGSDQAILFALTLPRGSRHALMRGNDDVAGVPGGEVAQHRRFEVHGGRSHEWHDTMLIRSSLLGA